MDTSRREQNDGYRWKERYFKSGVVMKLGRETNTKLRFIIRIRWKWT